MPENYNLETGFLFWMGFYSEGGGGEVGNIIFACARFILMLLMEWDFSEVIRMDIC